MSASATFGTLQPRDPRSLGSLVGSKGSRISLFSNGSKSSESEMVTPTLFDDAGPSLGHGYRCLQHDTPDHGYGDTILSTAMTLEVVPLWSLNVNAIRAGGQTTKASASVEQWCHDR